MSSIAVAAASGDHRAALEAMRDKLARDMDAAEPSVVAQIAGRLAAILTELAVLPVAEKPRSTLDELVERRENRLAAAKVVEPARKQTRQRRVGSG